MVTLSKFLFLVLIFVCGVKSQTDNEFLYSPEGRIAICDKKEAKHVKAIISDYTCLELNLKNRSKDLELVKQCWKEAIGVDYPTTDSEWIQIYCDHPTPYYLKNIASDCFFRKMIGFHIKDYQYNLKLIQNGESNEERKEREYDAFHAVVGLMDMYNAVGDQEFGYLTCFEVYSPLKNYIETFREERIQRIITASAAQKKPKAEQCPASDSDFKKEALERMKCVEATEFPENKTIIQQCWNDIVYHTPYPTSDDQWTDYLCSGKEKFPLAMMKLVEDCSVFRVTLGYGDDAQNEKDKGDCDIISPDDEEELVYYNNLMIDYDKIKNYNEICVGKKKELLEEEDPSRNLLKCVAGPLKEDMKSMKKALDYCWGIQIDVLSPQGSKKESVPKSAEEWMNFLCSKSEFRIIASLEQGNRCMKEITNVRFRDSPGMTLTSEEKIAKQRCMIL
jgi:hypothetical protein